MELGSVSLSNGILSPLLSLAPNIQHPQAPNNDYPMYKTASLSLSLYVYIHMYMYICVYIYIYMYMYICWDGHIHYWGLGGV